MKLRLATTSLTLLSATLVNCTVSPNRPTQIPYVELLLPRGDMPAFSAPVPSNMQIQRAFAFARVSRPGVTIDVRSVLEVAQLSCVGFASCREGATTIDSRPARYIRYRISSSYPHRLELTVPFGNKAFLASVSCLTRDECDFAQRMLQRGVFAEIAVRY